MGRALVVIGLVIAAAGALISFGIPLGRLPGDIVVRRDNFTFYFPLTTSIVVSVVLTILFTLLRR
jgi:formate hydrogenlyase subunit 3/multisubunit Na+/H+ antiporter MnhD subunit